MKTRTLKKSLIYLLLILIGIIFFCSMSSSKTYALANKDRSQYLLVNGRWSINDQSNDVVAAGNGAVYFKGEKVFSIFQYAESYSGAGTLETSSYINWNHVNIFIQPHGASYYPTHNRVIIIKNGQVYKNQSLSGASSLLLLGESLAPGSYQVKYMCKISKANVSAYYSCEYTYDFIVDNIDPTHKILVGESECANNAYINSAFSYVVSDENFYKSYSKLEGSNMNAHTTSTTGISANAANNGRWEFYAVDKANNSTPVITITLDTIKPTIKFQNESGLEISGITNKPFRAVFYDNIGLAQLSVLKPGSASYVGYNNNELISTNAGEYKFKGVDKAGNETTETSIIFDNIAPVIRLISSGRVLDSGSIVSLPKISAIVEDLGNSGLDKIYIKSPLQDAYISYIQGSECTDEGRYEFYAMDKAGNKSENVNISIDRTPPTINIYSGSNIIASNVASTDKIKANAIDEFSGIYKIYVKTPYASTYEEYTMNTFIFGNGNFSFYAEDKAFNSSSIYSINLDNIAPVGEIYSNGQIYSKPYISTSFSYSSSDENTGISYMEIYYEQKWRMYSGEVVSVNMPEGQYMFRAIDNAGNISDVKNIVLSTTKPRLEVYVDGEIKDNDSYINREFFVKAIAESGEIYKTEMKYPSSNTWTTYVPETLIGSESIEGLYQFRTLDTKGLYSDTMKVNFDNKAPELKAIVNGEMVQRKYVSGNAISFQYIDNSEANIYVKLPSSNDFANIVPSSDIYAQGEYSAYAEDMAGNRSATTIIVLDSTPKTVKLIGVKGSNEGMILVQGVSYVVDKDPEIIFPEEIDRPNIAPIVRVYVNSVEVNSLDTIVTLKDASYEIEVLDMAGNIAKYIFISEVENFSYEPIYGRYYELSTASNILIKDSIGNYTLNNSMLDYINQYMIEHKKMPNLEIKKATYAKSDTAFNQALDIESNLAFSIDWSIDSDYQLDDVDRVNRKNGPAYIYRSAKNKDIVNVYFTRERLDEVILFYARKSIMEKSFIDGNPVNIEEDITLTTELITTNLILKEGIKYTVNGEVLTHSFSKDGEHRVYAEDLYGNNRIFDVKILQSGNDIYFNYEGDIGKELLTEDVSYISRPFYISASSKISPYIISRVSNAEGDIKELINDESMYIYQSGKYIFTTYNQSNITRTKTIYLSLESTKIEIKKDAELVIKIKKPEQNFVSIKSIAIYKNQIEIFKDDLNSSIDSSTLTYVFKTSGQYKIVVEDNFRRGNFAVAKEIMFSLPTLQVYVEGLGDDAYTNALELRYIVPNNTKTVVKRNGVPIAEEQIYAFTLEGEYIIESSNADGVIIEKTFEIDRTAPEIKLKNVEKNVSKSDVYVEILEDCYVELYKDGVLLDFSLGQTISASGSYIIKAIDKASNISSEYFEIDRKLDYSINVIPGFIANSARIDLNSTTKASVHRNGELFEVNKLVSTSKISSYNNSLYIDMPGLYEIKLYDDYSNYTQISFSILEEKIPGLEISLPKGVLLNSIEKTHKSITTTEDVSKYVKHQEQKLAIAESGKYKLFLTADGKEYSVVLNVVAMAPIVKLVGVTENKTTTKEVSIKSLNTDGQIYVYRNNTLIMAATYENGMFKPLDSSRSASPTLSFSEPGSYLIKTQDELGNESETKFTIKKSLETKTIVAIVISIILVLSIAIGIIVKRKIRYRR